jgi:hypothetical protein
MSFVICKENRKIFTYTLEFGKTQFKIIGFKKHGKFGQNHS